MSGVGVVKQKNKTRNPERGNTCADVSDLKFDKSYLRTLLNDWTSSTNVLLLAFGELSEVVK